MSATLHYGGVDQPPQALRDLLLERVRAAPAGSEITWATYYFRDPELADALIAAKARGVRVRLVLEGNPRRASVNRPAIEHLKAGLGDGLRLHRSWLPGQHLHAKIYTFSGGPEPAAFIGSYNPSGGLDDPKLLKDIGDQDRGENLLVDFRDPEAVDALRAQARRIWEGRAFFRFGKRANKAKRIGDDIAFYFYPRLRPDVVERRIARLGPGDEVRAAVSHMDKGPVAARLMAAAQRGARVELVVHDTRRRVPRDVVAELRRSGVEVMRFCDPEGLPMHAKFVIVDHEDRRTAWFGSLNYNFGSRMMNQEILARSAEPQLVSAFDARFQRLADEAAGRTCAADPGRVASTAGSSVATQP
ncbi:MAG: phospholipase D family protein [Phenylobacterium sp.]|uniref:phospholipase D-like domain-containing protein n=1 Tax=Phenylobacterium sp. TaxID=1871053 RepID=UPI001A4315F0|nr:phospholipase D family protein [Phenylobacterium sp.]MBL8772954.1 phospholipase D family protein [Phenylobacterium sp.]